METSASNIIMITDLLSIIWQIMLNVKKKCLQYTWISHRKCNKLRDLLKDNLLGTQSEPTESFPPLLGSCFWGLSSNSFKRRLVTAGTSWTKLLLPAPLLLCSHSTLIGFDGISLIPQWKKEKGTWRCCREMETWNLSRNGGILLKQKQQ